MSIAEIRVPDLGDFDEVDVIEVYVRVGDAVAAEDPLIGLETDKAAMDVPSPAAGRIESVLVGAEPRRQVEHGRSLHVGPQLTDVANHANDGQAR